MTEAVLLKRLEAMEQRIKALESVPDTKSVLIEQRRLRRCHWVMDNSLPEGRFWLPLCYGGLYGKDGCNCR